MGDDEAGDEDPITNGRPRLAERRDLPDVYPPAEDSHLLAETVRGHVSAGDRALDVGTGTGFVGAAMAAAGADVVGVDVSALACERARADGLAVVRANLVDAFRTDAFDVVAFNPPYLPTPPEHEWGDEMERALSGGEDGRAVVEPFLDDVGRVLGPEGDCYLLVSTLTDVEAVLTHATGRDLAGSVIAEETYPFESLVVLRFRHV